MGSHAYVSPRRHSPIHFCQTGLPDFAFCCLHSLRPSVELAIRYFCALDHWSAGWQRSQHLVLPYLLNCDRALFCADEVFRVEDGDVVAFGPESIVRLEIRLPLHPDTTVQQWLELETEMSIKRLQVRFLRAFWRVVNARIQSVDFRGQVLRFYCTREAHLIATGTTNIGTWNKLQRIGGDVIDKPFVQGRHVRLQSLVELFSQEKFDISQKNKHYDWSNKTWLVHTPPWPRRNEALHLCFL